jgi:hypothetical protein
MVETAKGEVMKLSTHTIRRLFGGTLVLLAVAAIVAPTVAARGALDPWQQNLNAREEYAQMTDPWALNLLARQTHRDGGYATARAHQSAASVEVGASNGFDWGDAGIGAASAFGVMLLAAGTVIGLRKRSRTCTSRSTKRSRLRTEFDDLDGARRHPPDPRTGATKTRARPMRPAPVDEFERGRR